MWVTREEYILEESGLSKEASVGLDWRKGSFISDSIAQSREDDDTDGVPPDIKKLDAAIAEADAAVKAAESGNNGGDWRKARERRDDLVRLRRAESLYVSKFIPSICVGLNSLIESRQEHYHPCRVGLSSY